MGYTEVRVNTVLLFKEDEMKLLHEKYRLSVERGLQCEFDEFVSSLIAIDSTRHIVTIANSYLKECI